MKKKLIISFFLCVLCYSCKINVPYSNDMKIELKKMYDDDQKAQKYDLTKVQRKEYSDSMENEFKQLCKKNTALIKKYFHQNGIPRINEDGKETVLHFWLLTQHSEHDVLFQKKVLTAMKRELKKGNASKRNYAYLYDRVQKNLNKSQLYGTQMVWDSNGVHSPYKLKSPKN